MGNSNRNIVVHHFIFIYASAADLQVIHFDDLSLVHRNDPQRRWNLVVMHSVRYEMTDE